MKVIDLLKSDNGPKKFKYKNYIWIQPNNMNIYINEENMDFETYLANVQICDLGRTFNEVLNDEIVILEDKPEKIEKIKIDDECIEYFEKDETRHYMNTNRKDREIYIPRINWLIDKVIYLLEKSDSND